MGDILKHITELLEQGNNYTEPRPRPRLPNYFDALDGCEPAEPDPAATDKDGPGSKGIPKEKPNIDTSNPLRRGDNCTII